MNDCIFCKILNKEIPSEFVYEDDLVVAFFDIAKLAPVHILIIPKKHIPSINDLPDDESGVNIAGHMIITAKKLAKKYEIAESGYKLLFRTGKDGGQEVPHIHLHLIGGAPMEEIIKVKSN